MNNVFAGTWKLNTAKSQFDPKYVPLDGTVVFQLEADGYLMLAEGTNTKGERVKEIPQRLRLDGKEYPVPEAPGFTSVSTSPAPNRIEARGYRNGEVVGSGAYEVSEDGNTLTATAQGMGVNGAFETRAVFDRVPGVY